MIKKQPLVSILIPNRNHSLFLGQAIESALKQTYENIEIIVCDNCSNDNSIEVAIKYLDRGVKINKNPINIMSLNYNVLASLATGKYFMILCADDIIKPDFIKKSVDIMEKYQNVGYVHCERDYIDVKGNVTELDPFFNCSFMVSGEAMLPIYMMTDVGQAAQTLIRRSVFDKAGKHDTETPHLNIDREQWFRLSMISDYVYLRDKLSLIRIHDNSACSTSANTFWHPILLYQTINGFLEWGKIKNLEPVLQREKAAYEKLGKDMFHFVIKYIKFRNYSLAKKYLLFMRILNSDIIFDENYCKCIKICNDKDLTIINEIDEDIKDIYSSRKRNYVPPEGFIKLYEGE